MAKPETGMNWTGVKWCKSCERAASIGDYCKNHYPYSTKALTWAEVFEILKEHERDIPPYVTVYDPSDPNSVDWQCNGTGGYDNGEIRCSYPKDHKGDCGL